MLRYRFYVAQDHCLGMVLPTGLSNEGNSSLEGGSLFPGDPSLCQLGNKTQPSLCLRERVQVGPRVGIGACVCI